MAKSPISVLPLTTLVALLTTSVALFTRIGPSESYRPPIEPSFVTVSVVVPPGESTHMKPLLVTVPAALITTVAPLPVCWNWVWLLPLLFGSITMLPAMLPVRSSVSPLAKVKLAVLTVVSVKFSVSLVPKVPVSPVMVLLVVTVLPLLMVPPVVMVGLPTKFQVTPDPTDKVLELSVISVKVMTVDAPLTSKVALLTEPSEASSVLLCGTMMVSPSEGGPRGDQFPGTDASALIAPVQVYVVVLMMSVPPPPSDASTKDVWA